jgi:hypothetical protein
MNRYILLQNHRSEFSFFFTFNNLQHNGAFDTLFEKLTAVAVNSADASRSVICVSGTAA